jgi:hypothetical protein
MFSSTSHISLRESRSVETPSRCAARIEYLGAVDPAKISGQHWGRRSELETASLSRSGPKLNLDFGVNPIGGFEDG